MTDQHIVINGVAFHSAAGLPPGHYHAPNLVNLGDGDVWLRPIGGQWRRVGRVHGATLPDEVRGVIRNLSDEFDINTQPTQHVLPSCARCGCGHDERQGCLHGADERTRLVAQAILRASYADGRMLSELHPVEIEKYLRRARAAIEADIRFLAEQEKPQHPFPLPKRQGDTREPGG